MSGQEELTVKFVSDKLSRLKEAKELFEYDIGKKIDLDDFIDMLVKTFMIYREKRGSSESDLLQKFSNK